MKKPKQKSSDNDTRTIQITKSNGDEIQVDIPASWKITFGPAVTGNGKTLADGRRVMPMALRLYETDTQQRAIFTDVISFRDLSIPMRVKQVRVQEKDGYTELDGVRKRTTFQAKTHEWVPADDIKEPDKPLLGMPKDQEIFGKE